MKVDKFKQFNIHFDRTKEKNKLYLFMGYLQNIKSWTFEVKSFSSRLSHVKQL